MSRFGFSARFLFALLVGTASVRAADPTPTPTPAPTPIPNTTDLSKFKGRYRGFSQVVLDSGTLYRGDSKTRIAVPSLTSLALDISASIRAGGRSLPIDNKLTFTSDGMMRGGNLAPGALKKARFKGLFTATTRRITFSGTYQLRKLTGRFSGTVTAGTSGRFTLRYQIFPGENINPAYIYQYSGRASGSK